MDAGAGMRDEGRGMDKRACLLEERWHCISYQFFLSHHHHRCIAFPKHSRLLPLAAVAVAREVELHLVTGMNAPGVLLGILDLAFEGGTNAIGRLAGNMPAVLVDVSRTVIPRGLAVDLRRACVSGLEETIDTNPRTNLP